jgi:succinoglycan biosynthesis transport protein ExoP
MDKKGKKKFRLGDIIQKLNETKASSGDVVPDDPVAARPPVPVSDATSRLEPPAGSAVGSTDRDSGFPQPSFRTGLGRTPVSASNKSSIIPDALSPSPVNPEPGAGSGTDSMVGQKGQEPSPSLSPVQEQSTGYAAGLLSQKTSTFDSELAENNQEESNFDIMRYVGVIIRRRNIILAAAIVFGLFSLFNYLRAGKFYSAHARMLFSPGYQDIMGENTNPWAEWGRDDQRFNTHLELLKSVTVLKNVSDDLGNRISAGEIASSLTISRGESGGEKNDIVDIIVQNADPHTAQDVANQICKTYVKYMKEVNVQDITQLLVNLEGQIGKVQTELDGKENLLREFKEKNRAVQLSTETNITVSKLSQMELELQKTQLDMLESRERFSGINKQIGAQDINVIQSMTYSNPFQAKLAELELELNSLSAEYSPEHFKVKMVKGQIDKIKEAMKTDITREAASRTLVKNPIREGLLQELVNLSIEKSALEAKRTAQEQIIKQLDEDLSKLPSIELQFAQLTRETESLVEVLKLLKSRFEEARIKRDSQESDLKILEWAQIPSVGISSVPFTKVLIGLLIGIIIGIALAFGLEFLDQSVKDPQTIEQSLELPLLGIVPMIEMEKAIIDSATEKWRTVLEPFRALRATLKHLAASRQFKTLIVCSAVKGEGKTTLAANLAITFSLDGKKVILVDGDLRRAQMHTLFNVPKYGGLSDYLLGSKEVEDILKPTVHENLSVITAGEHPHNPSELIGSIRFEHLVNKLRTLADFVIFDSPALLPVSDGMIMAPKIDACIMVVRALWTPLKAAQQAKNQLKRVGCNIIGGILNGISHSRGYYPYYYGYYRYYAYKYTYEEDHDRPRRKPTIREIGLKVENIVRGSLRSVLFSFPQYRSKAGSFMRHLMRRKTFWLLVIVLCALPACFAAMKFLGIGANPRSIVFMGTGDTIQYIAGSGNGAAIENIGSGGSVQRPLISGLTTDSVRSAAPAAPQAAAPRLSRPPAGSKTFLSDSLELWLKAFNAGNVSRFLSFYDTRAFKYPGGEFRQWALEYGTLLGRETGISLAVDSVWSDSLALPYSQTNFSATYSANGTTARRNYSLVWQFSNNQWRIVRQKYKEQP